MEVPSDYRVAQGGKGGFFFENFRCLLNQRGAQWHLTYIHVAGYRRSLRGFTLAGFAGRGTLTGPDIHPSYLLIRACS